ncbi:hypothetical protein N658DRAFT_505199 [Parathielavia hyrcaniae]|uniref:Uncharacterized protein n=1 Tax=Parathielavia hyrcaniae TaxID=113614 RepID=A0AAN6T4A2_9PEZI|nr:hypothetical protein N658DRAFT_505199 [Parathielavia hyrcaniae]
MAPQTCANGRPIYKLGFCRRRHAVFSPNCTCWAPPGPALFLVCRTLSESARHVFFSRNRFIICDDKAYPIWRLPSLQPGSSPGPGELPNSLIQRDSYTYVFKNFAASEFLRDIMPAPALARPRPPPLPRASLPALPLGDLAGAGTPGSAGLASRDESNGAPDPAEATAEEAAALLGAYTNLLVRTAPGTGGGAGARPRALLRPLLLPSYDPWLERRDLKERLERYVMGARYESLYTGGREEPAPSDWDEMYFDKAQ